MQYGRVGGPMTEVPLRLRHLSEARCTRSTDISDIKAAGKVGIQHVEKVHIADYAEYTGKVGSAPEVSKPFVRDMPLNGVQANKM